MIERPCLAAQNIHYLEQGRALVGGLETGVYTRGIFGPRSGGVGGQVRHVIDYYDCFLRDLGRGRIDYDRRRRLVEVEQDPALAATHFQRVALRLGGLDHDQAARELQVKADRFGPGATEDEDAFSRSSVGRELVFLLSHTVHHFALIALMLRGEGVEVPAEFGVAPSTLEHWSRSAGCAP